MRASEFTLNELVTRADETDHLIKRAETAAGLCDKMGDAPLLFREFRTGLREETVLAKVTNTGERTISQVKGGGKDINKIVSAQDLILQHFEFSNPVFCRMKRPTDTWGFHGDPHILIPPSNFNVIWSPRVEDLGGQTVIDDEGEIKILGMKDLGRGLSQNLGNVMGKEVDKWIPTYQTTLPKSHTNNEIILDCDYYYLLNVELLLKKFAGKKMKELLVVDQNWRQRSLQIDPSVWEEKLKTYKDVAWYLRNPFVSFVKWYQEKVEKAAPKFDNTQK